MKGWEWSVVPGPRPAGALSAGDWRSMATTRSLLSESALLKCINGPQKTTPTAIEIPEPSSHRLTARKNRPDRSRHLPLITPIQKLDK
jgi:hypothetical protein